MDVVIDFYASGKMPNYLTAENLVDRLVNKSKRKDYVERTEKDYAKLVGKYNSAESVKGMLERGREKRRLRHVSVTMILYRKNEDDEAEKRREKTDRDTIGNVVLPRALLSRAL